MSVIPDKYRKSSIAFSRRKPSPLVKSWLESPSCSFFSGETIEAKTHEDVTMLFSDIVGFTSICSTATPMMVINMLQDLYNQFDVFCGQLDVYKVSSMNIKLVEWFRGVENIFNQDSPWFISLGFRNIIIRSLIYRITRGWI